VVSFDDLKVSLSTYIMRNKRVTYQDLLRWSSSNKVGNALLYLVIRELVRERKFKVSGEYVIGTIRIGNNDVKLSIPMYIEVPGETVKPTTSTKRQTRQRHARSSSILEAFSKEKAPEEKQVTTEGGEEKGVVGRSSKEVEREETPQKTGLSEAREQKEVQGNTENETMETKVKEVDNTVVSIEETRIPTDYSTISMEDFMTMLRRIIDEELPQNREEGYKIAMAILTYLSKYWSVGELRLKLDIAKQFGGVNENIMRIEDGVLRALRKLGIIEVVEPGVINRMRELPKDFVKVRLDSLFT
jgi:hypothetical protein